jgi:hypothetical protein
MESIKPLHRLVILGISVTLVIVMVVIVHFYYASKDKLRLNFDDKQSLQHFVSKKNGAIYGELKFVKESIGSAIYFDGKSYIDCGSSEILIDINENVTVGAWIKPKKVLSNQANTIIVAKGDYIFGLTRDERAGRSDVVMGYINGGGVHSVKVYIIPEQWNNVVLVYDKTLRNNQIKVYVNGALRGQSDYKAQVLINTDHIFVGGNGEQNFNGLIANVNIYNKALTEEEIKKLQQVSMSSANK